MSSSHLGFGEITKKAIGDERKGLSLPDDEDLKAEIAKLALSLEGTHIHNGVYTYFATAVEKVIVPIVNKVRPGRFEDCDPWTRMVIETARFLIARRQAGRYVDFFSRREYAGREIPGPTIAMSEGVPACMHWRGTPLFKTVFDFALYSMLLWELKPKTIFETGTAKGGSALWLGDLLETFGLDGHLYTVDLHKPDLRHNRVTFLEGDCFRIEHTLTAELLGQAPHPWLFLEDTHVNVAGVLEHMHRFTRPGDYFVIEDTESPGNLDEIDAFARRHHSEYRVDTRYTDFFGYNATCSMDTFWVRV